MDLHDCRVVSEKLAKAVCKSVVLKADYANVALHNDPDGEAADNHADLVVFGGGGDDEARGSDGGFRELPAMMSASEGGVMEKWTF